MRKAPLVACGLATKKLTGNRPTAGEPPGQLVPGNAFLPARLHMKVWLKASVFAKAPATPLFRNVVNVPLLKLPEAGDPKAAVKMGNATWPGRPVFPKLHAGLPVCPHIGLAAVKIFRLF